MKLFRFLGVLLICALLGGMQVQLAATAAAEPGRRPGPFPVAAFIGDSYTWGSGASTMDKRWTTLVAGRMGWMESNLGEGGTGYLKTIEGRPNYFGQLDEAAAMRPDIVVVAGGQNDQDTLTSNYPALFSAVSHFFVQLRSRLPQARIIGIGPSFPDALTPQRYAFDNAVRDAVRAVGGQFISLNRPTPVIVPAMLEPDRVHVDDAGHAAIAQRVLNNMQSV
ncbi:SGNH/GDSL hydrolase family protein [Mycolicibacterium mengxianglii]|uniref:SGNH/GDSL hydrolase family protein n=1 Tax=Mycolicibacterium mengxianglii TaxID=2736649 RepID=UPI0018D0D92F|nr:SGNH/GDSL hydrolase family protein [Mycolicibacterium mengxianglii]